MRVRTSTYVQSSIYIYIVLAVYFSRQRLCVQAGSETKEKYGPHLPDGKSKFSEQSFQFNGIGTRYYAQTPTTHHVSHAEMQLEESIWT